MGRLRFIIFVTSLPNIMGTSLWGFAKGYGTFFLGSMMRGP